ncbi:MAG: hypothetical protein V4606_02895 [Patescibacteria group bacterium]
MTADVRSLQATVPETFDFDSQSGILFILRAIRVAPIEQAVKNSLKDQVFLYNTGAKDPTIKQKLEQSLHDAAVTPEVVAHDIARTAEATKATVETAPVSGFGLGRLAPVFATSAVTSEPVSAPVANVTDAPIKKIAPSIPMPSRPVVAVPVAPTIVKVSVPTAPSADQALVDVVVPEKNPEPIVPVAPVVPIAVVAPAPVAPPVIAPEPVAPQAPTMSHDAASRMERIRVIKSTVNDRIGNPVNLVDVDNGLGREYMSALLEAMKLLSSASEAESMQAMNRLESVYTQVLTLLDTLEAKSQPAPVAAPAPAPTPVITPITPVPPISAPVVPAPMVDASAVERIAPVVPLAAAPVAQTPAPDFLMRSKVVDKIVPEGPVSGWSQSEQVESVSPVASMETLDSVANRVAPQDAVVVNRLSTPPAEPLRQIKATSVPSYQPESVQSVTDQAAPLRNLSELKTADEVSAIEAMQNNPLYTKDVDAGLEQLLGEWSIFKKSGLFGTGPKGREHPLYQKISTMHLPLILAGRFEGSTQEIKQSITDYMNGWRYEQGIVYDQGETLDQYLRRVIRHIIDLQKSKRRP